MALNSLFCADVPLSNYSLTHPAIYVTLFNVNVHFKSLCTER